MHKQKVLDLRNRTQLETAIFLICQYESLVLYGDFFPSDEMCKLVYRLITMNDTELLDIFEEQMDAGATLDYFKNYGVSHFIVPNGDIYNLMDGGWYVTIKPQ